MASPARRHRGRRALVVLAVVLAVPVAGYAALRFLLRDEVLRPRVIAAVEQATGRGFTLSGPIGLKLSLVPTVTLEGVALANAPGGSRAEMLTVRRVEAKLALLPLLSRRIAFERVTLIEPDLLLETDAAGTGNWRFATARAAAGEAVPATAAPAGAASSPLALTIAAIGIEGGRITWRGASSMAETLEIRDLALQVASPEAPIEFTGNLGFRGVAVAARGQAGPLPRLLGTQATPAEWPLHLVLAAPGMQAVLDGGMTRPEAAAGWRVSLNVTADHADRLRPFLPSVALPPLTGLDLRAELADAGPGALPTVQSLQARTAGGELGTVFPGLRLGTATLAVAGAGQPVRLEAALALNGIGWQAEATLPPLPALLSPAPWPMALSLTGEGLAARAEATLAGATRQEASGTLALQAADTLGLARAFGLNLPVLRDVQLDTAFTRTPASTSLGNLRLRAREVTAEGEASLTTAARPVLAARLSVPKLDWDALRLTVPAATSTTHRPAPAAPVPAESNPRRVIPALPLPLGGLDQLDAAVTLNVGDLLAKGVLYRDHRLTLALTNGKLVLDPVSLGIPGGRLAMTLQAETTAAPPHLSLTARHEGNGIELRPLLQAYRLPAQSSGRLELEAKLDGHGQDLRALAASLSGQLGLAMANGQIDNALLDRFAGDLRRLLVPGPPGETTTALRCFALRLALRDGVARPEAMLLESGVANIAGSGEIDLGEERLNLRLLPQVRISGVGISTPVRITGSFANPGYRLDQGGAAQAAVGIVGELAARQRESGIAALAQLAETLAGRPGGGLPDCDQQLTVARGGRAGPMPAAESTSRPQPQRRASPADLLRGLLGR